MSSFRQKGWHFSEISVSALGMKSVPVNELQWALGIGPVSHKGEEQQMS